MLTGTSAVAVPVALFGVTFLIGVMAAARFLPDLPPGALGGIVYFLVCGMLGAATGVIAMHIFNVVEFADEFPRPSVDVSAELLELLFESGVLAGLAAVAYLLAARFGAPASPRGSADPPPEASS